MKISDIMMQEFLHESRTTRKILERVPEDKLEWKPHEKSMTLGRLATHLAEIPQWADIVVNQDVFDMGANVSEWTADSYASDYPTQAPVLRPAGPECGERRVVRGGNFVENPYFGLLAVRRGFHVGVGGANLLGFRCAADPGQEDRRERSEGHEGIRFDD